ncbi:MAG: tRNA (adenosine(37)-N6)-threonylcarbamoyltransferase complex ATPase subunit type 1 TsaE [Ornithinimicrobium sp.]
MRSVVSTAGDAHDLGRRLAGLLVPGDLVLLTGELGAGKTTLTQGLGDGLGVRGPITSPTFVIARVHPSLVGGPALVHVDAYRLGAQAELDDLDLDAEMEAAVTVVEWGAGLAESLGEDRLEISLTRSSGDSPRAEGVRDICVRAVGPRWSSPHAHDSVADVLWA